MFKRLSEWFRKLFDKAGRHESRLQDYTHHPLYRNLMRKTQGNKTVIERLIQYERARNPRASQEDLLAGAVARWERDNR